MHAGKTDRSLSFDKMSKLNSPFKATHALNSTMATQPTASEFAPAQNRPPTKADRIE
jgi:hypothetical protein